jgi:hypothetical protein
MPRSTADQVNVKRTADLSHNEMSGLKWTADLSHNEMSGLKWTAVGHLSINAISIRDSVF